MPVEFDPAWEYAVVDPDLLPDDHNLRPSFDRLFGGMRNGDPPAGFRFGAGSPDHGEVIRLAPPRAATARTTLRGVCPTCRVPFDKPRAAQKYCSMKCRPNPGRAKELPVSRACAECGADFPPKWALHKYCSRKCAGLVGSRSPNPRNTRLGPAGLAKAAEMYDAGLPVSEISSSFGVVCWQHLRRRIRPLITASRPSGNRGVRRVAALPPAPVAQDQARLMVYGGAKFGDVYPLLAPVDRPGFREWYVRVTLAE